MPSEFICAVILHGPSTRSQMGRARQSAVLRTRSFPRMSVKTAWLLSRGATTSPLWQNAILRQVRVAERQTRPYLWRSEVILIPKLTKKAATDALVLRMLGVSVAKHLKLH